ncbi:hypothetical protein M7I_7619 [Glarea lozoyensis 74030]|uniref:Uncharacterized protein n=1 Tax=Glarea lozoyensis (strain ATCC 74030 / MF5533) TaxID=1104152 RepID=H0EXT0_GLAL7|nr:hypothetical protein M7I_7619 [Glarea lozoyensis 74030]
MAEAATLNGSGMLCTKVISCRALGGSEAAGRNLEVPFTNHCFEQMQELVPATSQLVAIFLKDPQLQQLFPEVMEKQADTEHFARYFPRLLRIFGDDLTIEAQEQAQKVAARYIKSEASHVTGLLQEKYGDGSTVSNLGVQAQEITLDNSDEEFPEEEALDDLEPVRKWIIESMAFSWLREALKSFVLRPSSIVVGKSSEGTNAIQGSEHSRSGQKEVGPGALQEQYEDVIDMIEVALGKSENYAWHPQVAVALDETLLRLEIWEDEITSEGEPKLDGILRIAGKEYRELSNTACEALAILQNRITAVLGWQERFAEALEE